VANTKSAIKRNRQAEAARIRNNSIRSQVRTAVKKVRTAIEANDTANVQELLRAATRTIDKAATKGVVKANAASRKISRLTKAVTAGTQAQQ